MRRVYRTVIQAIEVCLIVIYLSKAWVFEMAAALKHRSKYRTVRLTHDQKRALHQYWYRPRRLPLSSRWHRLYVYYSGRFDTKFMPEIVYTTRIEPRLNDLAVAKRLSDKSLVELLYSGNEGVSFPQTLLVNSGGLYYDRDRQPVRTPDAADALTNVGDVIIKPTVGENSGRGVRLLSIENQRNRFDGRSVTSILLEYRRDFIVQRRLVGHPDYARLHEASVNTVRIVTYICDGQVFHWPLVLRMGNNASTVDNSHAGGLFVGLRDDGTLLSTALRVDGTKYRKHPTSGVEFNGYSVPYVSRIIEVAHALHGRTPSMGIISWDFMIDDESRVVLIEINLIGQAVWLPQMAHGVGAFGENTDAILHMIGWRSQRFDPGGRSRSRSHGGIFGRAASTLRSWEKVK